MGWWGLAIAHPTEGNIEAEKVLSANLLTSISFDSATDIADNLWTGCPNDFLEKVFSFGILMQSQVKKIFPFTWHKP